MASILHFARRPAPTQGSEALAALLAGASLEVTPRTAAGVEDFRAILPRGTRVYIAQIDGTPAAEMRATARRLLDEGMTPMPHVPARALASRSEFEALVAGYAELGVREALVLGGGLDRPRGPFDNAMQLLESHAFDRAGFTRLHVAGHPEGSPDIAPAAAEAALAWKNAFQSRTDAGMALVTQFAFEAAPVADWARGLRQRGISLPVHVGVAGPAKLQTLIRYAMLCGVGPSVRVLQRRAADLSRLVLPFEPTGLLADLAGLAAAEPALGIEAVHVFPLGGVARAADYLAGFRRGATARARA